MITIEIDTRSISEQFFMDQDEINDLMDYTVKEITGRFAQEWENEVNRTLKSSRQEYIANINVVDEGFAKGAVILTGWLPNAIEQGKDGWDMKDQFLNGPNAKTGKDGSKYNTIPFTFGTPGALEENFTGGVLPQEIYDIARKQPLNQGIRKDQLPQQFQEPQKKSIKLPEAKSFKEYQHKHSIYEGVSKRKDKGTGQNTYGSFRRVSENSDPDSWIHPGFEAAHISDRVLADFDVPQEVGRIIRAYLK